MAEVVVSNVCKRHIKGSCKTADTECLQVACSVYSLNICHSKLLFVWGSIRRNLAVSITLPSTQLILNEAKVISNT